MTQRRSRLPAFASREEEAAFWETHSLAEFEDELVAAKKPARTQALEHHLSVRLEARVLSELAAVAREMGVGPSTLARMWIMRELKQQRRLQSVKGRANPAH